MSQPNSKAVQPLDCGLSIYRPRWLQPFATARTFLLVYGLLGTTQTMSFLYFNVTLTTLERRFKIPSGTTGIVLSGNEISQILLSLVLSYLGGRRHRPRWIAAGGAVSAVSCLILAATHFVCGPGEEATQLTREYVQRLGNASGFEQLSSSAALIADTHRLCHLNGPPADGCSAAAAAGAAGEAEQYSYAPLILIFMSQFVLGIGTTMYYTLGSSYLDDGIDKGNTPMTLAYALTFRMFGLILGFGLVSYSLHMYIDPWATPLIDAHDPRWLGAYWFGWLVLGAVMLAASWLAGLFPRQLPKQRAAAGAEYSAVPVQDKELLANGMAVTTTATLPESSLADFWSSLLRLLRNKLLMYNNVANVFYLLAMSVQMTYISKYMEVQFNRDSASATSLSGPLTILSTISGFLLSGWLITKHKPAPRKLFMWNLIVGVISLGSLMANLWLACDAEASVGNAEAMRTLQTECNVNCSCESVIYSPVCDVQMGRTYYSPCHAGCERWSDERKEYDGCACGGRGFAGRGNGSAAVFGAGAEAEMRGYSMIPGACVAGCATAFMIYTIIACVMNWLGATARIGNILLSFRCVPVADKSFAQGLSIWMLSLFAMIPGPILFGFLIDGTCLVWNSNVKCGSERGNCQLYDQTQFRWAINVVSLGFTACGVLCDGLVWWEGKSLDMYGVAGGKKATESDERVEQQELMEKRKEVR